MKGEKFITFEMDGQTIIYQESAARMSEEELTIMRLREVLRDLRNEYCESCGRFKWEGACKRCRWKPGASWSKL